MFEFSYFSYFWYMLHGTFLLNCSCSLFYYSCSMFFYEYVDLMKCSFSITFAWMPNVRTFVSERNEYWTLCNYIPNEIIRIGKPLIKQSCASWNYNTVKYGIKLWLNCALMVEMKSNIKIIIRIRRNVHIQRYAHLCHFLQKIGNEKENILWKKSPITVIFWKHFLALKCDFLVLYWNWNSRTLCL